MAKVTHIWIGAGGKKTPLELMDNEYLCNAYRRCKETTYEPKLEGRSNIEAGDLTRNYFQAMPRETAEKFLPLFEAEAKRRKLTLPKVDRHLYHTDLKIRMQKKSQKWKSNREFDKMFGFLLIIFHLSC